MLHINSYKHFVTHTCCLVAWSGICYEYMLCWYDLTMFKRWILSKQFHYVFLCVCSKLYDLICSWIQLIFFCRKVVEAKKEQTLIEKILQRTVSSSRKSLSASGKYTKNSLLPQKCSSWFLVSNSFNGRFLKHQ